LKEVEKNILLEIYEKTSNGRSLNFSHFYNITGKENFNIRAVVENFKDKGLVIEVKEDSFEISSKGLDFCKSRWA